MQTKGPEVLDGQLQPVEQVMEQHTAGPAVDAVAMTPLPELLQVILILQHLERETYRRERKRKKTLDNR